MQPVRIYVDRDWLLAHRSQFGSTLTHFTLSYGERETERERERERDDSLDNHSLNNTSISQCADEPPDLMELFKVALSRCQDLFNLQLSMSILPSKLSAPRFQSVVATTTIYTRDMPSNRVDY